VAVFGNQANAAEFASPDCGSRPCEAAQGGKQRLLALEGLVHVSKRRRYEAPEFSFLRRHDPPVLAAQTVADGERMSGPSNATPNQRIRSLI
jgi:hypothetical protein